MTVDFRPPTDPASFAAEVRTLARLTRRTLADPDASARQVKDLVRRVQALECQLGEQPPAPMARWLANLRRRLEFQAAAITCLACP